MEGGGAGARGAVQRAHSPVRLRAEPAWVGQARKTFTSCAGGRERGQTGRAFCGHPSAPRRLRSGVRTAPHAGPGRTPVPQARSQRGGMCPTSAGALPRRGCRAHGAGDAG